MSQVSCPSFQGVPRCASLDRLSDLRSPGTSRLDLPKRVPLSHAHSAPAGALVDAVAVAVSPLSSALPATGPPTPESLCREGGTHRPCHGPGVPADAPARAPTPDAIPPRTSLTWDEISHLLASTPDTIVFDTRPAAAFAKAHLPHAINVAFPTLLLRRLKSGPPAGFEIEHFIASEEGLREFTAARGRSSCVTVVVVDEDGAERRPKGTPAKKSALCNGKEPKWLSRPKELGRDALRPKELGRDALRPKELKRESSLRQAGLTLRHAASALKNGARDSLQSRTCPGRRAVHAEAKGKAIAEPHNCEGCPSPDTCGSSDTCADTDAYMSADNLSAEAYTSANTSVVSSACSRTSSQGGLERSEGLGTLLGGGVLSVSPSQDGRLVPSPNHSSSRQSSSLSSCSSNQSSNSSSRHSSTPIRTHITPTHPTPTTHTTHPYTPGLAARSGSVSSEEGASGASLNLKCVTSASSTRSASSVCSGHSTGAPCTPPKGGSSGNGASCAPGQLLSQLLQTLPYVSRVFYNSEPFRAADRARCVGGAHAKPQLSLLIPRGQCSGPPQPFGQHTPDYVAHNLAERGSQRRGAFPDTVSEIVPGFLYLGPEPICADDLDYLEDGLGVSVVVNLAAECEDPGGVMGGRFGTKYSYIPMRDFVEEECVEASFDAAYSAMSHAEKQGERVFCHCRMGRSRSVAAVLAYLVRRNHWTLEQAYEYVKKRRACICPNLGFVAELMKYSEKHMEDGDEPTK